MIQKEKKLIKWILVTGGSKGIGEQVVKLCLESGYKVAMCYSPDENKYNSEKLQGNLIAKQLSVTNFDNFKKWVKEIEAYWGPCSGLVANAGIGGASPIESMSNQLWDKVFNVNLDGILHSIKAVLPGMKKAKFGRIVAVSSIGAKLCHPNAAHYCASKAAVETLVKILAKEEAPYILVNAVSPGLVKTELVANSVNQLILEEQKKRIPLERMATPEEIATTILFLLGSTNTYITGTIIPITGGL